MNGLGTGLAHRLYGGRCSIDGKGDHAGQFVDETQVFPFSAYREGIGGAVVMVKVRFHISLPTRVEVTVACYPGLHAIGKAEQPLPGISFIVRVADDVPIPRSVAVIDILFVDQAVADHGGKVSPIGKGPGVERLSSVIEVRYRDGMHQKAYNADHYQQFDQRHSLIIIAL